MLSAPTIGGATTSALVLVLAARLPGNLIAEAPLIIGLVALLAGLMTYTAFIQALN